MGLRGLRSHGFKFCGLFFLIARITFFLNQRLRRRLILFLAALRTNLFFFARFCFKL